MLSIIIPVYNEENMIVDNYYNLIETLEELSIYHYEIIYGNDGSTDNTKKIIDKLILQNKNITLISWDKNIGLGYNYQQLYHAAQGEIIIQLGADFSTKASIIKNFIYEIENGYDVVIASRYVGGRVQIPFMRKLLSRMYNIIVMYIFHINLKDTQSGFVAFKSIVVKSIDLYSNKYDIHLELMYKITQKKYKIKEIPCTYIHRIKGAKFNIISDGFSTLIRTIILYYVLVLKKN